MNQPCLSLEEVLCLIKNPPLIRHSLENSRSLNPSEREGVILVKNNYVHSLNSLLSSKDSELFFKFGSLLNKYSFLFGSEISIFLNSLEKPQIEYILGELRFEKNLKSRKTFLPPTFSAYSH